MTKTYDFLKECGPYFLLTVNENSPAGRPFGALMEIGDKLYISTAKTKKVYKQLKENGNMQIVALKPGTRNWIRVTGTCVECNDLDIKGKMLKECVALQKHYADATDPVYSVFEVTVLNTELY